MKIEVRRVVTKLTKSMVSQMQCASLEVMRDGELLGYMINVSPLGAKVYLIAYKGNFYIQYAGWNLRGEKVTRVCRKGVMTKTFNDGIALEAWWLAYIHIANSSTEQIYV